MNQQLNTIIERKGFGVLYFDGDLRVTEANATAAKMFEAAGTGKPSGDLLDRFPEFIGVETLMTEIATRGDQTYGLDDVNRPDPQGGAWYWDLIIVAGPHAGSGMVLMEDVTERAVARQAINQGRYDQYLYRQSVDYRRNQIGTLMKGHSAAIREIITTIQKLSRIPSATVLLMGETGTGKSLTAHMIHESSMAEDKPFVEINCAALPEHLIEAELFGHEKGAFTHAVATKPGLLEAAHGGTLFLDEIGELPMSMQAKMLTVMESKQFRRLGSTRMRKAEVRIIAATNRDLRAEVAAKRFREDLFYRLNVVAVTLPPLRELGEDVMLIANHFMALLNVEFNKKVKGFTAGAHKALIAHPWPGNVRELNNCIERAMIFIEGEMIDRPDLVLIPPAIPADADDDRCWTLPAKGINLEDVERRLIQSALTKADQNKSKAARLLGLSRHTLRYRMEKYGFA